MTVTDLTQWVAIAALAAGYLWLVCFVVLTWEHGRGR